MTLRVAEVFGPTVQGEGPHVGHRCVFIRLSGCNLTCAWCDTPYTWDWTRYDRGAESSAMQAADIAADVATRPHERVVLTGGEPLVQQSRLPRLLRALAAPVDVETNGTITPTAAVIDGVALFVVSPKVIPSAKQHLPLANRARAMQEFTALAQANRAVFKYVARDDADLDAIAHHVQGLDVPVYVMPEGRTAAEVVACTARIADRVVREGWRLGTRLHVLAWGDERGR